MSAIITERTGGWDAAASFQGLNFVSPRVVHEAINLTSTSGGTTKNIFTLCTSAEFYYRSLIIAMTWSAANTVAGTTGTALTSATHGQIWNFWVYTKK